MKDNDKEDVEKEIAVDNIKPSTNGLIKNTDFNAEIT